MSRARRSDGDLTKQKILQSAGQLIAQHGFAQTTNKAIAQMAEVDLAAINYHFDGRDGLYKAVLAEAHQHFLDEKVLIAIANAAIAPEQKLAQLFETLITNVTTIERWYSKIFILEMLSPSPYLIEFIETNALTKFQLILKIVSEIIDIDVNNPILMPSVLSIIAPIFVMILANKDFSNPVQVISAMPKQDLVEHFKTFSLAGLAAVKAKHDKTH